MSFKLSPRFLSQYDGKQPKWGFGALSYFVYKRTYARLMADGTQEEYSDTCRRVTEGTFTAQKNHCKKNGLEWQAHKAQKTAQEFYRRMWDFKFTPPGRGFWIMGTELVDKVGSAALNNCLAGDTEIITSQGIMRIDDAFDTQRHQDGGEYKLLTRGGKWIDAPIKCYGQQELYRITLTRQGVKKIIHATSDHRWFTKDRRQGYRSSGWSEFTTEELRPGIHRLQYSFGQGIKNTTPSPFGVAHGFVFGDGCKRGDNKNSAVANLIGDKDSALVEYFKPCPYREIENGVQYSAIPNYFKDRPSIKENKSYLYGWLAGYFSADGSCKSDGTVKLSSVSRDNIDFVRSVCSVLGIGTYSIQCEDRISNLTNRPHKMFSIVLMRQQLTEDFFIIPEHRDNFVKSGGSDIQTKYWTVESVDKTSKKENVFCAEVADYNAFTLADNILTGNCGFTSTKDVSIELGNSFAWAMDMLMLGVGVGFDTKGAGQVIIKSPTKEQITFVIPDSREGWVESVRLLMNSYHNGGNVVTFDYSKIRPRGEPIRGFGGTASGPGPLEELHKNIRGILGALDGESITSVAITDLMNFIGKCVVAGNVRRSAELAIGEIDDTDYIEMKDYKKYAQELKDRRWASNNSVFSSVYSDFHHIATGIALNGEPGLIFLDNARHFGRLKDGWIGFEDERYDNVDGFNPCAEQCLEDKELCTLVETYPANHDTVEDYLITLKYAYMYAKTITLIPTHNERTNAVMMRNRRIGCSMSGVQQAIKKFGLRTFLNSFCDKGYEVIRGWDRTYSRWLGVPRSVRMTTVKPSGTVSILAGATPGVHFTHSEYYWRTVRIAADSPLVMPLWLAGYRIEVAITDNEKYGPGIKDTIHIATSADIELAADKGATLVVYFPVKEENFTKSKFDVTLWEQLSIVREMQHYWSDNAVVVP
ncbi:hypothetical protein E4G67_00425 [Candidatus Bathyarchaeota archaeon]|nr:MAG: hypothetical protein E4G67_00425 [Candidatus Bathyarchaeota archaeon]